MSEYLDICAKIMQIVVSFLGIISIIFAAVQLRAVTKNTKVNVLKAEFDIFGKISEKEIAFVDTYEECEKSGDNASKKDSLYNLYKKNREQYLNELNLLCLYIDEGYFTKEHFFQQYGKKILSIHGILKEEKLIEKYIHINKIVEKYETEITKYHNPTT